MDPVQSPSPRGGISQNEALAPSTSEAGLQGDAPSGGASATVVSDDGLTGPDKSDTDNPTVLSTSTSEATQPSQKDNNDLDKVNNQEVEAVPSEESQQPRNNSDSTSNSNSADQICVSMQKMTVQVGR